MTSLGRTLFSLKNVFGIRKQELDQQLEESRTKLRNMTNEYFKMVNGVESIPKSIVNVYGYHLQVLNSLHSCVTMSDGDTSCNEDVTKAIEIYQKLMIDANKFQANMHNELLTPLKTYGEQFNELDKRFKVCDKRKEDMDYCQIKLNEVLNKPVNKQKGLNELQAQFSLAKDRYEWLKFELIDDVNNLCNDTKVIAIPVVRSVLNNFTECINSINSNWGVVPNLLEKLPADGIVLNYVIKAFVDSMEKDSNVEERRSKVYNRNNYQVQPPTPEQQVESAQQIYGTQPQVATPINGNPYTAQYPQTNAQPTISIPPEQQAAQPAPVAQSQEGQVSGEKKCKVEYDYDAQEQNELSIKVGDVISIMSSEGDWWIGKIESSTNSASIGKIGQFPSNYVSLIN